MCTSLLPAVVGNVYVSCHLYRTTTPFSHPQPERTLPQRRTETPKSHAPLPLCFIASEGRAKWTTMAVDRKNRWISHRRVAQIRGGSGGGGNGSGRDGDGSGGGNGNGHSSSDRPWTDPPTNPRTPPTNPSQSLGDRFQSAQDNGEIRDAPTVPSGGVSGDGATSTATATATPLVASSAPLLPEALPAGPVNPSSRSVPVLRLSSEGAAVETTVSLLCVCVWPMPRLRSRIKNQAV